MRAMKHHSRRLPPGLALLSLLFVAAPAPAQMGDPTKVELKSSPVAGTISIIEGANGFAGGNVAAFVGDDGVLLVDDEFEPLSAKLKAKVAALTPRPVKYVVNTHWHFDHAGGNAALGGGGAVIVAHDNTRKRLAAGATLEMGGHKMTIPPTPAAGLPAVTFAEDVTLHFNGDDIHIMHVPPAHTDTDVVVHFAKANVVHTGDLVMGGVYPIIDPTSGGRYEGFPEATRRILALCDDKTRIIPGHGTVIDKAELSAWREMVIKVGERVKKLMAAGKSLEQIKAAKPAADFDGKYGKSFIPVDMFIEGVYKTAGATRVNRPK
jgi:glyoxylase-like metal-dependent hydrolase (beta-lactamase superfamily II)